MPRQGALRRERYLKEAHRLYGVLDKRLSEASTWQAPIHRRHGDLALDLALEWHQVDIAKYRNVLALYKAIAARPAVVKGYHIPSAAGHPHAGLRRVPQ